MARPLSFPASPRSKWIVFGLWLAFMFSAFGANLPGKFQEAEQNESTSYLPGDAESTKALTRLEELQDGERAAIVIVYRRAGGLTPQDQARIGSDRTGLNAAIARFPHVEPFGAPQPSPKADAVLLVSSLEGDGETDTLLDPIDAIRERVSGNQSGLEVAVTGPAGYAADAVHVFEQINGTLFLAAFALVVVLLILIYRSPLFFWIPLFAVLFAEMATRSIGYGLTELGVTVNTQSSSILSVLVLGAGTDYALLLVSRYREELTRHEDKHEALALALRTAGPAIVASGVTVMLALLCLTLAEDNGTRGLGPIGALGILVAMVTMLTLLPAMLAIFGRRAFWRPPIFGMTSGIPHYGDTAADETHGAWRRVGERVAQSPRRVWVGVLGLLAVMCIGFVSLDMGLTSAEGYREKVESVEGQKLISKSFPGGANAPTEILVPEGEDTGAVIAAVKAAPGVVDVREVERGKGVVLLNATLDREPYATEALELIPGIRAAAKRAGGEDVLVGGATAVERDVREAAEHDSTLIPPIALVVVLLVLIVLLRALVIPVILIATVIASFAASLGFSLVVFDVVFDFPGIHPSLPLFAFVFLVALGIDYNIFLMARAREETARWGTRHGMIRALAVTGAVITSAGVVLAGTFSILALLPLVFLTEIGFVIAFGVLVDTLLVRSLLVPALVLDMGPRIWWPSKLAEAEEHDDLVEDPYAADRARESTGTAPAPTA